MESRPAMAPVHAAPAAQAAEPIKAKDQPAVKNELAVLVKGWHAIVERVGRAAPLAKSNLLDACPAAINGNQVLVGFDPEFADRVEQAAMPRNRAALQKVLGEVLHRAVVVEFKIMQQASAKAQAGSGSAAGGQDEPEPAAGPKAPLRGKHKWMAQESVQKTLDMFNGRILDIKE
jgi:hypothetical protein